MKTANAFLFHTALGVLAWIGYSQSADAGQLAKPNIIVILSDDVGYGDVSCYGATAIHTPNIDRLAAQGLRFTNGYCSASTCTPTRYSLITGTYAFRAKRTGIAPPNAPAIIQPGTPTIASLLKQAGYRTAVIGKWHLGLGGPDQPDWNHQLDPGPLEIGFDYCFILPTTPDRVPEVFVENHRVRGLDPKDPIWVGDHKPFADFPTGLTERDKLRMDWSHGHHDSVVNGIGRIGFFSGGKYTIFEGGTRVPFITCWPGRIQPGLSEQMVCTIDLAASLAALTGVPMPRDGCLDSFNLLDALLGKAGAKGRECLVEQDNGNRGHYGFRAGRWKLQRHGRGRKGGQDQLFDLAKDPAEKANVAARNPEVVQRLAARLDAIIAAGRSRP